MDEATCKAGGNACCYGGTYTQSDSPTGCLLDIPTGWVVLNLPATGAANARKQPLCRAGAEPTQSPNAPKPLSRGETPPV